MAELEKARRERDELAAAIRQKMQELTASDRQLKEAIRNLPNN